MYRLHRCKSHTASNVCMVFNHNVGKVMWLLKLNSTTFIPLASSCFILFFETKIASKYEIIVPNIQASSLILYLHTFNVRLMSSLVRLNGFRFFYMTIFYGLSQIRVSNFRLPSMTIPIK